MLFQLKSLSFRSILCNRLTANGILEVHRKLFLPPRRLLAKSLIICLMKRLLLRVSSLLFLFFALACSSPKVGCPALDEKGTAQKNKKEQSYKSGSSQLFSKKMTHKIKGGKPYRPKSPQGR